VTSRRKKWSDLTPRQQRMTVFAGAVQLSLAALSWADLARRPRAQVNGPKAVWAAVIAVNFVGPLAYLRWGRRT